MKPIELFEIFLMKSIELFGIFLLKSIELFEIIPVDAAGELSYTLLSRSSYLK